MGNADGTIIRLEAKVGYELAEYAPPPFFHLSEPEIGRRHRQVFEGTVTSGPIAEDVYVDGKTEDPAIRKFLSDVSDFASKNDAIYVRLWFCMESADKIAECNYIPNPIPDEASLATLVRSTYVAQNAKGAVDDGASAVEATQSPVEEKPDVHPSTPHPLKDKL